MSCYSVTFLGPDPESSTDHDSMIWIDVGELHSLSWAPADIPIIEGLAEKLAAFPDAPPNTPPSRS